MTTIVRPTVLIVGASRGLGHAMAAEFLRHGWNVIGTVRSVVQHDFHLAPPFCGSIMSVGAFYWFPAPAVFLE